MEAVKNDPRALEMVKALGTPRTDAEAVDGYLKVAEAAGCSISREELIKGLKAYAAQQKAASDKTAEKISLRDMDLENVAGGGEGCADTYQAGEWCCFTDSCSVIITGYNAVSGDDIAKENPPYIDLDSDEYRDSILDRGTILW